MTKKKAVPTDETIVAYKGFDKDFKCRDMQYSVAQTFEHSGPIKACHSGLHSCENPLDVFSYYEPGISRFAVVEASGSVSREVNGDSKIASAKLHIKAELSLPEFIAAAITWVTSKCSPADSNHATGDRSASSATGIAAVAMNIGRLGKAKASADGAIVLCFHNNDGTLRHIRCSKVGENGIEPDVFYTLSESGEFVREGGAA